MTLKGNYAHCFITLASFGSYHENLNEDRPILSATKMYPNDSRFWQYKVYADTPRGSMDDGEGASKDSGVIKDVDFEDFRTLRLRHLRK